MLAQQEAVRGEMELNRTLRSILVKQRCPVSQENRKQLLWGGHPLMKITNKAEQERYQLDVKVPY